MLCRISASFDLLFPCSPGAFRRRSLSVPSSSPSSSSSSSDEEPPSWISKCGAPGSRDGRRDESEKDGSETEGIDEASEAKKVRDSEGG
jgi:hypothetical protein